MGTTNWCLRRGRLGSSQTCLRHSDARIPDSFLCLGMTGRLPLTRFGVISLGCSVSGEPQVQVRRYFYQSFVLHSIVTNSSVLCFVQLRDGPNLRAGTSNMLRLLLSTRSQLTTLTIWSILALWLCTALVWSPPLSSCALLRLERRKVSILFSSSLILSSLFSFLF